MNRCDVFWLIHERKGTRALASTASFNPNGRPPKKLPADGLALIQKLAARGVRERDIARACGMGHQTFHNLKQQDQSISDALDAGRQQMHDALIGKLYSLAMKGEIVPLLFILKSRFGYSDGQQPQDQRPQVIINLPAPASVESYPPAQIIEHDSVKALEAKRG